MIAPERMKKFDEIWEKSEFKGKYSYVDTTRRFLMDEMLKTKKTCITSFAVMAAVWRAILDTKCARNMKELLDAIEADIKSDKIDLTKGNDFYADFWTILTYAVNFIFDKQYENKGLEQFNWNKLPMTKEFVFKKMRAFLTFGTKSWVEPMPKDYFMKDHTNPENANMLHRRNKGVIELELKVSIPSNFIAKVISWENMDKISDMIQKKPEEVFELTCKNNYGAIITNGTAILGLGNIGALAGMPVMEGKSVLFKYFGGTNICPLCIQELDNDKLVAYCQRVAPSFCIINLEDIRGPDCFFVETKLIETVDCPMFHDDQHGTACVVLAGLINSVKLRGSKKEDVKIVMNGAGASGLSVCNLLLTYGFKHIIVCDTSGAIYHGRPKGMNAFKEKIAEVTNLEKKEGTLSDVIKGADIVVGLSQPGAIKKEDIQNMASKPIIFALANPTPEIFPKDAFEAGAFIMATGRSDFPNQINNSLVFPGVFRGAIDSRASKITVDMKVAAGIALAELVKPEELKPDMIIPGAFNVGTAIQVAVEVARCATEKGQTKKKINLDRVRENINSFFIDNSLMDVDA